MIDKIFEMLKLSEHFGISENIEIAKGKYKINNKIKDIYKQEKRKQYFKKKRNG